MKILLTGNNGYIGTVLGQQLVNAGHDVVGMDTNFYAEAWLYNMSDYKKIHTVVKDIRKTTIQDLQGFEVVIHLAELSNDPLGENDPEITYEINHLGTKHVATLAKLAKVKKFIYFSSCSVYGASDEMVDELSGTNPLTAYAKSKVLNEQFLSSIADDEFSPIIFRNATVYGASPRLRFDLVVNNLTGLGYTSHEIKMNSDGTPWRPLVHVLDLCSAVILALNTSRSLTHNQIINVGDTNSNYQIKDVAEMVNKALPNCKVSLNKDGADKRNYKVNFNKIKKVLPGFNCIHDVADGALELLSIFNEVGLNEKEFESRDYTRLKQIKYLLETGKINKEFYWN